MKKVVIISNSPLFGGAESFILSTLSGLEKEYSVSYIVANKHLGEKLKSKNVIFLKSKNIISQYIELRKILKSIKPDILLFNGASLFYFIPFLKKYHIILYRHSTNSYAPISRRWLYRFIMSICYKYANLTIHVSNFSAAEQHIGKKVVIHNGVSIPSSSNRELKLPLNILYCSRLEPSKGILTIMEAFKQINEELATLTIIGDGSLKKYVEANAKGSINYLGFQNQVEKYYKSNDILILMSDFENFPLSILEAMSYGLPVITTGAGGIKEVVLDNINGWIIKNNPDEIKNCVLSLCNNLSRVRVIGDNARKYCNENLNIESRIKEIVNAIEKSYANENRN